MGLCKNPAPFQMVFPDVIVSFSSYRFSKRWLHTLIKEFTWARKGKRKRNSKWREKRKGRGKEKGKEKERERKRKGQRKRKEKERKTKGKGTEKETKGKEKGREKGQEKERRRKRKSKGRVKEETGKRKGKGEEKEEKAVSHTDHFWCQKLSFLLSFCYHWWILCNHQKRSVATTYQAPSLCIICAITTTNNERKRPKALNRRRAAEWWKNQELWNSRVWTQIINIANVIFFFLLSFFRVKAKNGSWGIMED